MFPFPLTSLLLLLSQHAVSTSAAALQARASPSATAISPVVFPPSQNWDGDDGPWSSFALRLGNPAQVVRVLPATAGTFTTVVLPLGCNTTSNPIACAEARGKLFDPTQSKTWQDKGPFGLGVENNLGYSPVAGEFGIDSEGFTVATLPNLTYPNQIIAGIAVNDFYVGTFGLGTQPTNFSTFEDTHPSFFTSLRNNNNTPSYTWSYTAGAQYQLTGVLGTLVFGGYDSSLFIPNNLSIPMSPDVSRDLVVGVQGITLSSNTSAATTNLLPSGGIFSFVDSTLPYIWLPLDACQAFERAFGLTWNETHELYLVNDTLRTSLQNRNLSVTFTLGVGTSDGETVDITLPYAAFDKTATPPLVPSTTGYFPLKRAANATQYTLGRTFLQEAYLIADYERNNFSLSQCQFIPGAKQNIVTIRSLADETAPTGDTGSNKLSGGAIAGIVIAPLVVLPGIFFIFAYKRKVFIFKEKPADMAELSSDEAGPSRDQNAAPSAFAATAAAAAGTDGAHTDPTSPELEGATPKPAVEAMSKPVGSEMEANDLTGFYAPKRAEMEGFHTRCNRIGH
ncbi:aspartic peptidase domain-containing protein [Xylogone sp. PMI_703]|nr:aspartic peptidase domain-containing protein [Xylogone sp. PMI_703]